MVVVVPPNLKISQLKRKIENEFEELYPRENPLLIQTIEDISGRPLRDTDLVGDFLKQDDRVYVYPKSLQDNAIERLPYVIDPKDLITTIKQAHYTTVAKLTESQLEQYKNKVGAVEGLIGLGFNNDKAVIQNLSIVMNKLIDERNVFQIYDEERHRNILDITVLVLDSWIQKYAQHDNLILANIIKLMEVLVKSRSFYNKFKDRPSLDILQQIARDETQPAATRSAILRINSALAPTLSWNTAKYFQTPSYVKNKAYLLSASETNPQNDLFSKSMNRNSSTGSLLFSTPMYKRASPTFVPLEQDLYKSSGDPFNGTSPFLNGSRILTPSRYAQGILGQSVDQAIFSQNLSSTGKELDLQRKWLYDRPHYKLSFKDKLPPVDHRSGDMLQEYLELIHIDTTPKDYVMYAIHNIELMLDYAMVKVMNDRTKFLSIIQIFQYTDLPYIGQESQLKIIEAMTLAMNNERAYDFLKADGIERIIFAYKHYHPKFRPYVINFMNSVFTHGQKYLEIQKLINYSMCEHDLIKESSMKALCNISERKEMYEITTKFQMHIPYLIECANSTKDSIEFVNYSLQTLANLARKESLKPFILYNEGLNTFVHKLRDLSNMTGRRIAGEALHNVANQDEFLRARITEELKQELKRSWRNEVDPVVNLFTKGILKTSGDKEAFIYS
eukprot:403354196